MNLKQIRAFELEEIKSTGYLYSHSSGAEVLYIKNSDPNKVFSITFKTPVWDDRGTAHVLEHCLLCGSEGYPVRDPFNEMSKGSLHTYLNAMTFKDKTMYPVASCNHKDFLNLVRVYLDAVFLPKVRTGKEIFMQEGINFILDDEGKLAELGGIVYNEMRGVYSDPAETLIRRIYKNLYNGSQYAFDSGGTPEYIAELTFQELLDFYNKNYHPSNAYVYMYGDLDFDEVSGILEKYLAPFEHKEVHNEISVPEKYGAAHESITAPGEKKYFGAGFVIGDSQDDKLITAFRILTRYLLGMEASPLKRAFIDGGYCQEIMDSFNQGIKWPAYSIVLKNSHIDPEKFSEIFNNTLEDLVKSGLEEGLLQACINKYEFALLEENYGIRPKGLVYNIDVLTNWIHGGNPEGKLEKQKVLKELKNDREFFVEVIRRYLLENPNRALVTLLPGGESPELERLERYKASLTPEELMDISRENKELEAFRQKEDKPEDLEKIPLLALSEIKPLEERIPLLEKEISGIEVLHCPIDTGGIVYANFMFDLSGLPKEILTYAGMLRYLLGKLGTESFTVAELQGELGAWLGGFSLSYDTLLKEQGFLGQMVLRVKAIEENADKIFLLSMEVINKTLFREPAKIRSLLKELSSKIQDSFISDGHVAALGRIRAYKFQGGRREEYVKGIEFYSFLENVLRCGHDAEIMEKLQQAARIIFDKERLTIGMACGDDCFRKISGSVADFYNGLGSKGLGAELDFVDNEVFVTDEAFVTPSRVQYVTAGYDFKKAGFSFDGKMAVLASVLNGNILLRDVRIKGGAYGCYCGYNREGLFYFYSYRDPNLGRTLEVYESCGRYLKEFSVSPREMQKFIIGSLNRYLRPKMAFEKFEFALNTHLRGISQDDFLREQLEILDTDERDLRRFSELFNHRLGFCVAGSDAGISAEADLFRRVERL